MRTTRRIAMLMWALVLLGLGAAPLGAQTAEQKGGPQEGIKVHGQWTLVIRNSDGSIAARHEFENALHAAGASALTQVLAGTASVGRWAVHLSTSSGGGCNPVNLGCTIAQAGFGFGPDSQNLVVTIPNTGPNAGRLVLQGSVKVPAANVFGQVQTWIAQCTATTLPGVCSEGTGGSFQVFSVRGIASGVQVAADQTVDVTVVISFS